MTIFIHALGLKNYRGVGDKVQFLNDLKKFNIFIGANNSGKSTFLSFIHSIISNVKSGGARKPFQVGPFDRHLGGGQIDLALGFPKEAVMGKVLPLLLNRPSDAHYLKKLLNTIYDAYFPSGTLWIKLQEPFNGNFEYLENKSTDIPIVGIHPSDWRDLWSALTQKNGGSIDIWKQQILDSLIRLNTFEIPEIDIIPAIRQVGTKGGDFVDYSGTGLISKLLEYQNPTIHKISDKIVFSKINKFLKNVTGHEEAYIEIPFNQEHILVHMNGRTLPLESLGTGIHETIMIASFCTISSNRIVCIEEPEIHLHPILQRKLLNYLSINTDNQYFIATHSPSFIDMPDASVYHVNLKEGKTYVQRISLLSERHGVCRDLGYKASDIVQANCIIWVEGPSDRIYINNWIQKKDPYLREGINYSIMFYGGRLLSHLSAADGDISDFIELRNLNRNLVIVIDSDKKSAHSKINDTKRRLANEVEARGGICWITKGREIENYVDAVDFKAAALTVHPEYNLGNEIDYYTDVTRYTNFKKEKELAIDKIKVAREVSNNDNFIGVMDLEERINDVISFIKKSNE